jgi:uncharacterized protein
MRIDIHTHPLWRLGEENLSSEEEFLNQMDVASIDRAVLLPIDTMPEQLDEALCTLEFSKNFKKSYELYIKNCEKISFEEFKQNNKHIVNLGLNNRLVYSLCLKHPDRFIGFGSVNPARSDKKITEYIDDFVKKGFKGIKLMPTIQFFNPNDNNHNHLYEKALENNLILLFHTSCDPEAWEYAPLSQNANPKYLDRVAREYPNLKIIAAHMGSYSYYNPGIWFEEMMKLMEKHSNVYTDIAALRRSQLFGKMNLLKKAIKRVGVERILFGSDYPAVEQYSMVDAANTIDKSMIYHKEKIMGENARRLLNI